MAQRGKKKRISVIVLLGLCCRLKLLFPSFFRSRLENYKERKEKELNERRKKERKKERRKKEKEREF